MIGFADNDARIIGRIQNVTRTFFKPLLFENYIYIKAVPHAMANNTPTFVIGNVVDVVFDMI